MLVVVTYDVNTESAAGRKRLRKVADACEDYGLRVQNSVFECRVQPEQFVLLQDRLQSLMNEKEDTLTFYHLGKNWQRRVERFGRRPAALFDDTMYI